MTRCLPVSKVLLEKVEVLPKFKVLLDSRSQMFFKICVRKNFAKFTGKRLCQSLFFNKVVVLGLQFY